jgi:periplasmic copper chaperone A
VGQYRPFVSRFDLSIEGGRKVLAHFIAVHGMHVAIGAQKVPKMSGTIAGVVTTWFARPTGERKFKNMSLVGLTKKAVFASAVAGALVLGTASMASAHVTVSPSEAASGGYAKLDVRVPHGCEDAATETLRVQVPDGIYTVTPQIVAGWEVSVNKETLDEPVDDGHGGELTEKATEIVWTGGPLPNERLQEFGVSLKMPELDEGETLYFPAIQECEGGSTAEWIEIPSEGVDSHSLESPAPGVTLTSASDDHGSDMAMASDTDSDDGTGTLTIVALVIGALGLLTGLIGTTLGLRKKS